MTVDSRFVEQKKKKKDEIYFVLPDERAMYFIST